MSAAPGDWLGFATKKDGTFEGVVLPGRGLLAVRAWGNSYLRGLGADRIKGQDDQGMFPTYPHLCHASDYNTLAEINPAKGAPSLTCNIQVDPGRTLTGTVTGPDGKPLEGAHANGLGAGYSNETLKAAAFTVRNLRPGFPRAVAFLHPGRRLAGFVLLRGDEKAPLTVKLRPWATVTGRLVDGDGVPLKGIRLTFLSGSGPDRARVSGVVSSLGQPDKDGKFRVEGLVPGLKYHLAVIKGYQVVGYVLQDFTPRVGETKDLGNVRAGKN